MAMLNKKHLLELRKARNSLYYYLKCEFLYHSNKIEGSTFSTEQLALLMDKEIVEGSHRLEDVIETSNSLLLFDYMISTLGDPITEDLLLEFHKILKKNTADESIGAVGVWKKYKNHISGSQVKLAEPHQVLESIKNLNFGWEVSEKTFEAIVDYHVKFEKIHPFQDGNGRVGRFIMLKQCFENEITPIVVDSDYNKSYKQALEKAQITGEHQLLYDVFRICQDWFANKDIVKGTIEDLNRMTDGEIIGN